VQGLGPGPDVSHAVDLSREKTEGNGVGDQKEPPVGGCSSAKQPWNQQLVSSRASKDVESVYISIDSAKASVASFTGGVDFGGVEAVNELVSYQRGKVGGKQRGDVGGERERLTFSCRLADGVAVSWHTVLVDGSVLYISIPDEFQPVGSRDSLVSLLDYAEGTLQCRDIVVCLRNNRPGVIRLFMYLGFSLLEPSDPLIPGASPGVAYMAYHVDDDDDDDGDDDDEVVPY